jgi:hypothetical protein
MKARSKRDKRQKVNELELVEQIKGDKRDVNRDTSGHESLDLLGCKSPTGSDCNKDRLEVELVELLLFFLWLPFTKMNKSDSHSGNEHLERL